MQQKYINHQRNITAEEKLAIKKLQSNQDMYSTLCVVYIIYVYYISYICVLYILCMYMYILYMHI